MFHVVHEAQVQSLCDYPHEKINQCLTDINRCLTDIFRI